MTLTTTSAAASTSMAFSIDNSFLTWTESRNGSAIACSRVEGHCDRTLWEEATPVGERRLDIERLCPSMTL